MIKLNDQISDAYHKKGVALFDMGRVQEAIECYDKAIKIYADHDNAYHSKGIALKALGRQQESRECFSTALKIFKSS